VDWRLLQSRISRGESGPAQPTPILVRTLRLSWWIVVPEARHHELVLEVAGIENSNRSTSPS
jgi:hypothetical protein